MLMRVKMSSESISDENSLIKFKMRSYVKSALTPIDCLSQSIRSIN